MHLGVPPLQADKARQAFMKSARETGYLLPDSDVLAPSLETADAPTNDVSEPDSEERYAVSAATVGENLSSTNRVTLPYVPPVNLEGSDMSMNAVDPLIAQVLQEIPKSNQPYSEEDWNDWFSMFSETYKWAKRRARQRVVQSQHGDER
jgi:hypothetical protein